MTTSDQDAAFTVQMQHDELAEALKVVMNYTTAQDLRSAYQALEDLKARKEITDLGGIGQIVFDILRHRQKWNDQDARALAVAMDDSEVALNGRLSQIDIDWSEHWTILNERTDDLEAKHHKLVGTTRKILEAAKLLHDVCRIQDDTLKAQNATLTAHARRLIAAEEAVETQNTTIQSLQERMHELEQRKDPLEASKATLSATVRNVTALFDNVQELNDRVDTYEQAHSAMVGEWGKHETSIRRLEADVFPQDDGDPDVF